jgi:hypothetical protein
VSFPTQATRTRPPPTPHSYRSKMASVEGQLSGLRSVIPQQHFWPPQQPWYLTDPSLTCDVTNPHPHHSFMLVFRSSAGRALFVRKARVVRVLVERVCLVSEGRTACPSKMGKGGSLLPLLWLR